MKLSEFINEKKKQKKKSKKTSLKKGGDITDIGADIGINVLSLEEKKKI
jgi:hypothetical protein